MSTNTCNAAYLIQSWMDLYLYMLWCVTVKKLKPIIKHKSYNTCCMTWIMTKTKDPCLYLISSVLLRAVGSFQSTRLSLVSGIQTKTSSMAGLSHLKKGQKDIELFNSWGHCILYAISWRISAHASNSKYMFHLCKLFLIHSKSSRPILAGLVKGLIHCIWSKLRKHI